jgi:hypothetical protein
MVKKAIITIHLVEESTEKSNKDLEKEIFEELSAIGFRIPWFNTIEKVNVMEET